jgi:two-component system CheB/CheR fusion protein
MATRTSSVGNHSTSGTTAPGTPEGRAPARRVLIADDNIYMTRALQMVLELWGFEVTVAHDGPSAVDAAYDVRPDAILLDIMLPKLDGLEVARRIRHHPALGTVLLLALTGSDDERARSRSLEAGFDEHLVKPVDPSLLRALLQNREGCA